MPESTCFNPPRFFNTFVNGPIRTDKPPDKANSQVLPSPPVKSFFNLVKFGKTPFVKSLSTSASSCLIGNPIGIFPNGRSDLLLVAELKSVLSVPSSNLLVTYSGIIFLFFICLPKRLSITSFFCPSANCPIKALLPNKAFEIALCLITAEAAVIAAAPSVIATPAVSPATATAVAPATGAAIKSSKFGIISFKFASKIFFEKMFGP